MAEYLDLEITADPEVLVQDGRDWLQANAPAGYAIDPLVEWILAAVARMAVEVAVLTGQVPLEIFQTFGTRVLRLPSLQATSATGTATFTLADTAGHTIPADTQIDVAGVGFLTTADLVVPAGQSTGSVPIAAVMPGSEGNDLSGAATLVSPTFVWVSSVSVPAATGGGVDGESGDQYVDRVADELPTLSPKAILIRDFEALARRDLEVYRALAIDNLVPPATTGVEGAVTVALMNEQGGDVSAAAKTRVESSLQDGRVLALDVHVINATRTTIDVTFTATAQPGYDAAAVEAQAEAAVAAFLSALGWGNPGGSDPQVWQDEPTVRRNDLFGVLYAIQGIRHVATLTLALGGGVQGTADVALAGPAGIPQAGVINGTVTP